MARRVYFWDAIRGSTEDEIEEFLKAMKKRRMIWFILTLIPFVNWVFGSFFIYTHNTIRVLESNGHKQPGGLLNTLVVLYCFIIPPIVMNWIIKVLGENFQNSAILGVGAILKQYRYKD